MRSRWLHLLWVFTLFRQSEQQQLQQNVRCDLPADVVFLLDASASINPEDWEHEKGFVGILIDSLAVESHAVHVGLIVYSTEIGQVVDLQPFKSRSQLKGELPGLEQTGQGTDTARAIARMRQMIQNQARPNAKKIAVVITDGRSENSTATIQEAVYARQVDKITMVALGVGNETYIDELEEIAKSDFYPWKTRLFTVTNFALLGFELQKVVEELRDLICEVVPETTTLPTTTTTMTTTTPVIITPDLPPISCPSPADVVFLLDGSHSITDLDWATGRVFVSLLVNSMEVDVDAIHSGIIVYSSDIGDTVPLKPFLNKSALKAKVDALTQPPLGRTNTALGLRALRDMFNQHGRPDVPHIGIVITDGKSSNVQATINEAMLAKAADGVVMLVVGVGKDTLATELEAMATSSATLFNVTDFSALFDIAAALKERICIAIDSTTSPMITTTAPVIPDLCQECLVEGGVGYNSYPPDCSKYVVCYPTGGGGYRAEVKDCPFGLYWNSQAVACVDAVFVYCTADPCMGQPDGWGHTEGNRGCGEYWVCQDGRSLPRCCPGGHRYSSAMGCFQDPTCRHECSLRFTVAGSGACPYRPNPDDPYSYLQITPGYGHTVRPCSPGTVYSHGQCACVFNKPSLGCAPSLHYNFDKTFDDKSAHGHPAEIHRVLLNKNGAAYFNGTGHVKVNTLPSDEFKDNFVLRLRYRVQPEKPAEVQWNDHYKWGMQEWFDRHTNPYKNFTFSGQRVPGTGPEPVLPSGQRTSTLEKVVILNNGTVVHGSGQGATPGGEWDMSGRFVTRVHLGPIGEIGDTAVSGGVLYVPNKQGQLLVMNPKAAVQESVTWQIVSKDGRVLQSGTGPVPPVTAAAFKFKLRPDPTTRWFIMTATGTVLKSGTGTVTDDVKNLFAGFTTGKLLKVDQIGPEVVSWSVSKPDGSGANVGQGPIPEPLRQQLKLGELLRPEGGAVQRWAVVSDTGDVLQSGTGDIPADVMRKYSWLRSGMVLSDTGSHWKLQRTDGSVLQEGSGNLPAGVSGFIQDSVVLPTLVESSRWTATLPNGTTLSGNGPVPDHIKKIFDQWTGDGYSSGGTTSADSVKPRSKWYLMDNKGQVVDSGFDLVPQDVMQSHSSRADTRFVQQTVSQDFKQTRWEVRGPGGSVLASGEGQPPADIFKVLKGQQKISIKAPGMSVVTSGTGPITNTRSNISPQRPGGIITSGGSTINRGPQRPGGIITSGSSTINRGPQRTGGIITSGSSTINRGPQSPGGIITSGSSTINRGPQSPGGIITSGSSTINRGPQRPSGIITSGSSTINRGPQSPGGIITSGSSTIIHRTVNAPSKLDTPRTGGSITRGVQPAIRRPSSGGAASRGSSLNSATAGTGRTSGTQEMRQWTIQLPDGTVRSGSGVIPADLQALMNRRDVQTIRRWKVTMPDGSQRSGEGDLPADLRALLASRGSSSAVGVNLPSGASGTGGSQFNRDRMTVVRPGVETLRRWTVTMPDGTKRSGTGDIPADLQALLDQAKSRSSSGGSTVAGGSRVVRRQWTVTMPNGTVRTGTGDIPADLQALLKAQRATGGLRTQRRWSVTLPDGSRKSGRGAIPQDVQQLMAEGSGSQRRWRVRMADGTTRTGRGAIPTDLASLMQTSTPDASTPSRVRRAAVGAGEVYQDVLGNCGSMQPPSFLLQTSQHHIRLTLGTSRHRTGATLRLPISPGMNDVSFEYDGKTLRGFSNGIQKSVPVTGSILSTQAPVVIGRCRNNAPAFRGEIDEVSLSSCIP